MYAHHSHSHTQPSSGQVLAFDSVAPDRSSTVSAAKSGSGSIVELVEVVVIVVVVVVVVKIELVVEAADSSAEGVVGAGGFGDSSGETAADAALLHLLREIKRRLSARIRDVTLG